MLVGIARGLSVLLIGLAGLVGAQASVDNGGSGQVPPGQVPTMQSIHAAAIAQDVTATRIRRYRCHDGSMVSVRELLETNGAGSAPKRDLTFLGVEGEPVGSALSLKWSQTYQRFNLLLATSGVFCVRDLARAQQNYTLYDFGPVVRSMRSAHRFVVFPNTFDRAFWVIDVDQQTSALLYSAEFDGQMRMLSEVEVVAFQPSARSLTTPSVATYSDFTTASAQMTNSAGLIAPDVSLVSSYGLDWIEVRDDVLSGQQVMVSNYSDGVDQLMVVQIPGTSDWMAGLPGTRKGGQAMGRRYRDPTMSVHMFWEGGVTFHVAGGGALANLEQLAKHIYQQAVATQ